MDIIGKRIKIIGNHPHSGEIGIVESIETTAFGKTGLVVKLEDCPHMTEVALFSIATNTKLLVRPLKGAFIMPRIEVVLVFNPSSDLTAVQNKFIPDATILSLLALTGKTPIEIAKNIIKRSQWADLAGSSRRLCVYFCPARKLANQSFNQEVLEVDCHVPIANDYIAYQVQEQVYALLQKKEINNRALYFDGQLGELPTAQGFFCVGSRYIFNRKI